jgi:hypothetical protein
MKLASLLFKSSLAFALTLCFSAKGQFVNGPTDPMIRRAVVNSTLPPAPTPDLFWWKLMAGSGTTLADSGTAGTHGGTIVSASQWQAAPSGYSGYSLTNNGSSWFEETTSTLNYGGTNRVTLSFWLWVPSGESSTAIIFESSANFNANGQTFVFYISGSGQFTAGLNLATLPTHCTYTPTSIYNAWHQYTVKFDFSVTSGTIVAYQDGLLLTQGGLVNGGGAAGTMATQTMYWMARGGSSLWTYGGLADVRCYSGDQTAYALTFYQHGPGTL